VGQAPNLPLLIVAQSGRLLAQSAIQAGYTVWVADCFLDVDNPAHRTIKLPELSTLTTSDLIASLVTLSGNQKCYLVYGSGIEYFPTLLDRLPSNIQIAANPNKTLKLFNTPKYFFALLQQLDLPFPETRFSEPMADDKQWLIKPTTSLGGQHIKRLSKQQHPKTSVYYQRYIDGHAGSVLFLSTGKKAHLLSINKQLNNNFLLTGIEAPLAISSTLRKQIDNAVNQCVQHAEIRGLNSLDFIIDQKGELFFLELNPRPSASQALITNDVNLINLHIDACVNDRPTVSDIDQKFHKGFYYFFAPRDIEIPSSIDWPDYCADIPSAGTLIKKNHPLCSFFIETKTAEECQNLRDHYYRDLIRLFTK